MFAIGIHYLNGWAMAAADGAKKEQAEWPPHPDRVFMALAAAWFETGEDPVEGAALLWMEKLPAPAIAASDAENRQVFKGTGPTVSYVPVNDTAMAGRIPPTLDLSRLKEAGLSLLPEFRSRQPRTFPVAIPHDPVVHLAWPKADPGEHLNALSSLARKVVSVGHSASLVQMWVTDTAPEVRWQPTDGMASHRLRVFGPGRLDYLAQRFNRLNVITHADMQARIKTVKGKEKRSLRAELESCFGRSVPVSLRPEPSLWQGYGRPAPVPADIPGSLFDPRLLVLALSGKKLGLHSTLKLTEALRGAILSACKGPIPEWLSGHTEGGAPTKQVHVALIPLPFVGREHADGRLMGIALALPRGIDPTEAAHCLEPLLRDEYSQAKRIRLFSGKWLECEASLETRESPPWSLQPEPWVDQSRTWASVTPVVLDRHFDGHDKWEKAAEGVKDAVARLALPRPIEVLFHPVSLVEGVPRSSEFPWLTRKKDGGRMQHAHAVIVFEKPVCGPLLVGAGRFRGYGLCRPLDGEKANE